MDQIEKEIEFYKLMKEEYRQYITSVEKLWHLKIIAIGAIIAYTFLNDKIEQDKAHDIIVVGLITISILVFFIDVGITGIGFHLKNISKFLEVNLDEFQIAKKWENSNWSGSKYARLRTFVTFLSTIGVSMIIYSGCLYLLSDYLENEYDNSLLVIWSILMLISVLLIIFLARSLNMNKKSTASNKAQNVHID